MANELYFPKEIIHQIQSQLTGKESAQTSILSKSWYTAWSTRPVLVFDENDFPPKSPGDAVSDQFSTFCRNTLNRYTRLNLKADKFVLRIKAGYYSYVSHSLVDELIVSALKLCVSEVVLGFDDYSYGYGYFIERKQKCTLPSQVFASTSLTRLSVYHDYIIDGVIGYRVLCSRLKSLVLYKVQTKDDVVRDILLGCPVIENLDLYGCVGLRKLNVSKLLKLVGFRMLAAPKGIVEFMDMDKGNATTHGGIGRNVTVFSYMRRLDLRFVTNIVDVFTKFSSMFPCIEDLTLGYFAHNDDINISSHSLKRLSLYKGNMFNKVQLDAPNISKFIFKADCYQIFPCSRHVKVLPSLSFDNVLRDWESDVELLCSCTIIDASWFVVLRRFLIELSFSRISLCITFYGRCIVSGEEIPCLLSMPVVENLTVCACGSVNTTQSLLLGLSRRSCHPKHIRECKHKKLLDAPTIPNDE